ncbi:MAG: acetyl/propionyl/methylcrotonyl-CoA carboxylase subunit alpha [Geminicoccaceae bacterium]|nr:acetyl/propionyl/methylcrotonyl-CoA carboxylase subunit alpha [Geminicoccaceae bacterium]
MFAKILVANRGEIACRVMATARRLGVSTVAVYSSVDSHSKHVAMADEAVLVGDAPPARSYLLGDRIIEAALRTKAQAIHPGYGFLSENPDFVDDVERAGLVFIGPPASAIRAMGLKDAAKVLMERAGVPVVPGYHGESRDPGVLAAEAARIGYPVLIKARAGGGGKGMRLVGHPDEFASALEGAQREALSSFGDPACLVERYVTRPRHVEIQVFADSHGQVVHLFERDCSLQRRHQKVIEEAPAPGMTMAVRDAMGRAAVEAARTIGYRGAGTVEFIADGSGPLRTDGFWFMEMNTRLQVEHPVTEAITGLDLVELQLRVAAGEALPFGQEDLAIDGHAFEARIYAEDVGRGFLPATGRLDHFNLPDHVPFRNGPVRIDSGVREGDAITPYYDPMIAKLVVHGPDRAAALHRLETALAAVEVAGSTTNVAFLAALARHEGFARGEVDTGLIARDLAMLDVKPVPDGRIVAVAAIMALGLAREGDGDGDPWVRLSGWRSWATARPVALLGMGDEVAACPVHILGEGFYRVDGPADGIELECRLLADGRVELRHDGMVTRLNTALTGATLTVYSEGAAFSFHLPDPLAPVDENGAAGGDVVRAPMPGLVKLVETASGDRVRKGQRLFVLEAMKMEHVLAAPRDGVVREVTVAVHDQADDGMVLLRLEAVDEVGPADG